MGTLPAVYDWQKRVDQAEEIRINVARAEAQLGTFHHRTNGDEERYANRIGNFSKGFRQNELGEVDLGDYDTLLAALKSGDFNEFEAIQLGGQLKLLNPLGGLAINIEGPDSPAVTVDPPPPFASAETAAQMAELYWMALCRDVPFTAYDTDPIIAAAVDDLDSLSGYTGPKPVTPQNVFRVNYPGVIDGPIVSQFLLRPVLFDGMLLDGKVRVPLPVTAPTDTGIDFLTSYEEWLCAQRGFPLPGNQFEYPTCVVGQQVYDDVSRFLRSARDLGQIAGQDAIYSAYFRASMILNDFGLDALDDENPYKNSGTQSGFATFGVAHLLLMVGSVHKAERHAWFEKWFVHRYLQPEVFAGRVHNHVTGRANYPIDQSLLKSPVLDRIFEHNRTLNRRRGIGREPGTFLLPILFPHGSPIHPSFPSGHAQTAGTCVTLLKAWFNEDFPIPNPVQPNADGTALEPYNGVLTVGGELNKLAHNLSMGRDMSGVHWRADDIQGNRLGEEVALRILREARATYPEPFNGFTIIKFDGTPVIIV